MAKLIKQDGVKRVFIYDDGSEVSFDEPVKLPKPKKKKKETVTIEEASEVLDSKED